MANIDLNSRKWCELAYEGKNQAFGGFVIRQEIGKRHLIAIITSIAAIALKSSIKFTAPVITADENVADDEEIKTQEEMTQTSINISIADVQGVDTEDAQDIADFQEVIAEPEPEEEKPFEAVEQMPQFPGGDAALMKYISSNLNYPTVAAENGIQGRVILRFVVSKTGSIENIQVLRSPDPSLEKEAIRVVKSMPKWVPGKQNGVNVPVYFTLPVTFKLQ